ncbi:MAG: PilN domain-containing protein [Candidatus Rokubacteria bacterium]|nr:PilN domain-containing protein [Candidatus Rokubacteria bacterium]
MIRINLAPPEGRPRRGAGGRFQLKIPEINLAVAFAVAYAIALIVVGAWWWQLSSEEADLTQRTVQAASELEQLKVRVGQVGKVRDQVADLKKRVDAIQELTKNQVRPVVLFDALADVVPRELWLTGLEERGTTLRITGTAFSATAVADFMANLRSSGRFKEVDIVLSRQDLTKTPRQVTFEVTCRFES